MHTLLELMIASNYMKVDVLGGDEQQMPQSSVLGLKMERK